MSTAPSLPGMSYLETLGSGGFATVHLYEQELPRRQVAVKVLHTPTMTEAQTQQFFAEAHAMAQLSSHPSIVTIYHAGLSPEGAPYVVMEYCGNGSLAHQGGVSVEAALDAGVALAGAVETAHRAGIIHRDIKPANVLLNDWHRPVLSDFGISDVAGFGGVSGDASLSVPWAPPEFFANPPWSGPASDVYGLAATVYTLVAGRAPFATEEGPNSAQDQAARMMQPPQPLGSHVPESLAAVLTSALARNPQARPTSAMALGRSFQQIQRECGYSETRLDVAARAAHQVPADATVMRTEITGEPGLALGDTRPASSGIAPPQLPEPSASPHHVASNTPEPSREALSSELDDYAPVPPSATRAHGVVAPTRGGSWWVEIALGVGAAATVTALIVGWP